MPSRRATAQSPEAATADAIKVAQEIQPFAVINGPALTHAFATTLDAATCHEIGRPIVDGSGPLPEIEALGMRGDA